MSTEKDQWDEMAEEILWNAINAHRDFIESIMKQPLVDWIAPALAAKLREMQKRLDTQAILNNAEIEKLKEEKLAEAERVTERDCNVLDSLGDRVYSTEVCEAIRAWQARERKR